MCVEQHVAVLYAQNITVVIISIIECSRGGCEHSVESKKVDKKLQEEST